MTPVMRRLDDGAEMPELLYVEAEVERRAAVARHSDETAVQREERLSVHRSVNRWKGDS